MLFSDRLDYNTQGYKRAQTESNQLTAKTIIDDLTWEKMRTSSTALFSPEIEKSQKMLFKTVKLYYVP